MNEPSPSDDLRWDTYLVVFTHAVLLLILWGTVCVLASPLIQLIGDNCGTLPLTLRMLFSSWYFYLKYGIIIIPLAIGFLFADGWVYSSLCRSKGKRAGTIWAMGVTTVIVLAIAWHAVVGRLWLNELVRLKIK